MALSKAAQDYAEALCPAGDRNCIQQVGSRWEELTLARFGAAAAQPPTVERLRIVSSQGAEVGSLTFDGSAVNLCLDLSQGRKCAVIGSGLDGVEAAIATLSLMHGYQAIPA
jgi:hypothetical protein